MSALERVCVFCGSKLGHQPEFRAAAQETAKVLVHAGITVVYGGTAVGLMGVLADTVLAEGGEVIGIFPEELAGVEAQHQGLTELHVVGSLAERKSLMAQLSDAFIALPGGLGTIEEVFDMAVRNQIGQQHKPIGLLNVRGYYDHLLDLFNHAVEVGLVKREHTSWFAVDDHPGRVLARLESLARSLNPKLA